MAGVQVTASYLSGGSRWFVQECHTFLTVLVRFAVPKKGVLFIIGDWSAKVGSQETPGVTGKFGLGIQNETGQSLIEFCQENALVIADALFQQHKKTLHMVSSKF